MKPFVAAAVLVLAASLFVATPASAHRSDPPDLVHELDHAIADTNALRGDLGRPDYVVDLAYRELADEAALTELLEVWQARFSKALKKSYWWELALCESNGDWAMEGYYHGGFSFHPMTWRDYRTKGLPRFAYSATPAEQIRVARRVLADQGWEAWPACSQRLGLR